MVDGAEVPVGPSVVVGPTIVVPVEVFAVVNQNNLLPDFLHSCDLPDTVRLDPTRVHFTPVFTVRGIGAFFHVNVLPTRVHTCFVPFTVRTVPALVQRADAASTTSVYDRGRTRAATTRVLARV